MTINKRNPGPKRSKEQIEADYPRIAEWYVKGWSQYRMGQELGISKQSVNHQLKNLIKRWREDTALKIDDHKARELAKLNHVEKEYWEAWDKSKEASRTAKQRTDARGETKEIIQTEEVGDPRYLQGVMGCIDRRCKILGVDAPVKSEISGGLTISDILMEAAKETPDSSDG